LPRDFVGKRGKQLPFAEPGYKLGKLRRIHFGKYEHDTEMEKVMQHLRGVTVAQKFAKQLSKRARSQRNPGKAGEEDEEGGGEGGEEAKAGGSAAGSTEMGGGGGEGKGDTEESGESIGPLSTNSLDLRLSTGNNVYGGGSARRRRSKKEVKEDKKILKATKSFLKNLRKQNIVLPLAHGASLATGLRSRTSPQSFTRSAGGAGGGGAADSVDAREVQAGSAPTPSVERTVSGAGDPSGGATMGKKRVRNSVTATSTEMTAAVMAARAAGEPQAGSSAGAAAAAAAAAAAEAMEAVASLAAESAEKETTGVAEVGGGEMKEGGEGAVDATGSGGMHGAAVAAEAEGAEGAAGAAVVEDIHFDLETEKTSNSSALAIRKDLIQASVGDEETI
jgi:hypothetical protein